MAEVTIRVERPDGWTAIDCTPVLETARWSSANNIGFSTCTVNIARVSMHEIPLLSRVTVCYGDQIVWQGLVEDRSRVKLDADWGVQVTAAGYHRELDRTAMQRWYARKDWQWEIEWPGFGAGGVPSYFMTTLRSPTAMPSLTSGNSPSGMRKIYLTDSIEVIAGQVDPGDPTRYGLRFTAPSGGATILPNHGYAAYIDVGDTYWGQGASYVRFDTGITRVRGDFEVTGSCWGASKIRVDVGMEGTNSYFLSPFYSILNSGYVLPASGGGSFLAIPSGANQVRGEPGVSAPVTQHVQVICWNNATGPIFMDGRDSVDLTAIRTHHTPIDEDTDGTKGRNGYPGFWAGTLLRDVISVMPALTPGQIATGADFSLDQYPNPASPVPVTARRMVDELRSYHDKRFGVWEGGRVDWLDRDASVPEWTIRLDECVDHDLSDSVDGVYGRVIVTGQFSGWRPDYFTYIFEVGFTTISRSDRQLNPFVRTNRPNDLIISIPFPITPSIVDALGLAIAEYGSNHPRVRGTLVVPSDRELSSANGRRLALEIRGGEDVLIPDLPVEMLFRSGAHVYYSDEDPSFQSQSGLLGDHGQSMFTIAGVETDLSTGLTTLEIDNHNSFVETLLARLALVTEGVVGS